MLLMNQKLSRFLLFLTSILGEQGSTAAKSGDIAVVLIFTYSLPFRDFLLKNHYSFRSIFL